MLWCKPINVLSVHVYIGVICTGICVYKINVHVIYNPVKSRVKIEYAVEHMFRCDV